MSVTVFTDHQIALARKRRSSGCSWVAIGRELDVQPEAIRRAADPEYRMRMNQRVKDNRARRRSEGKRPNVRNVQQQRPLTEGVVCDTDHSYVVMSGGMPVSLPRLKFMEAHHGRS